MKMTAFGKTKPSLTGLAITGSDCIGVQCWCRNGTLDLGARGSMLRFLANVVDCVRRDLVFLHFDSPANWPNL